MNDVKFLSKFIIHNQVETCFCSIFCFVAPSAAPNLTVTNITGDTIDISIGNIAEDMENGIVQYYQVRLTITEAGKQKEVFHNITGKHSGKHTNSNYSNFAHPCSVVKPHEKTSQERSFKLENLKYYTEYSLAGKACTDAGCGPFSASKTVKTDEYIPFCSPHGISIIVLSSTQLRVTWNRPPTGCSNGLIIKYKISTYYRHWDGNGLYLTFENFTQAETITLTQLKKYSGYCFNITAFTSKGHGPYSGIHCEKTLQDSKFQTPMYAFNWISKWAY